MLFMDGLSSIKISFLSLLIKYLNLSIESYSQDGKIKKSVLK